MTDDFKVLDQWQSKPLFRKLRQHYTYQFYKEFFLGFKAYEEGDWEKAKQLLNQTSITIPNVLDGPSQVLLEFMEEYDWVAPNNWQGFREVP